MFLNQTAAVARLTADSIDSDKEAYSPVAGLESIAINVQPATPELTAVSEGVYGQTFRAFTPISNIKIGDQLTMAGSGIKYIVKGVDDWNYAPIPHLELLLFKGDN